MSFEVLLQSITHGGSWVSTGVIALLIGMTVLAGRNTLMAK